MSSHIYINPIRKESQTSFSPDVELVEPPLVLPPLPPGEGFSVMVYLHRRQVESVKLK